MTQTKHMHDERVGTIAPRLAGASEVFRRYGIDFCSQGHATLKEAANHRGLDPVEVEAALAALDASEAPQVLEETDALVEHIQTRYHDIHRRQLGELIELSRNVEAVHVTHPEVPAGLAETLTCVREELEVHMKKEELMIFPAMRRRRPDSLSERIREMRHDHDDHARFLDQIARLPFLAVALCRRGAVPRRSGGARPPREQRPLSALRDVRVIAERPQRRWKLRSRGKGEPEHQRL